MSKNSVKNLRLLGDRLLVEPIVKKESKSAGGLILPTTVRAEDEASEGRVILSAARVANPELDDDAILEGDVVLYSKFAGTGLIFNGVEYKILRATDISVVNENERE